MSIEQLSNYIYTVRVLGNSELLKIGAYADLLENCGELVIESNMFGDYRTCMMTLSQLLSSMSSVVADISGKPHVLVSKMNPRLDLTGTMASNLGEAWDTETLLRLYVADADLLKEENVPNFTISGEIKCDHASLTQIRSLLSDTKQ